MIRTHFIDVAHFVQPISVGVVVPLRRVRLAGGRPVPAERSAGLQRLHPTLPVAALLKAVHLRCHSYGRCRTFGGQPRKLS